MAVAERLSGCPVSEHQRNAMRGGVVAREARARVCAAARALTSL